MKKIVVLLFSLMILLVGCGTNNKNVSQVEEANKAEEVNQVDEDYYNKVFDTSDDSGKLTVRYLWLKEDYMAGDTKVTTGDSSVYTSPDGFVMLVDCGNQNCGVEVAEQLKAMGIKKIDIFVLSHPHADHIGGFVDITNNFDVGQIYMNSDIYDSDTYRKMMDNINSNNIPYKYLEDGDEFTLGKEVNIKVYSPNEDDISNIKVGYMDDNDCSIAMRIKYKESSFWTSGDLYTTKEKELVDKYGSEISSDVMKMDHHGWDTSNNTKLIETIKPLIAVGMHDSITSKTVAMRYSTKGALTFYTCVDGAVKVATTGDGTYDVQSQLIRDISFYGEPSNDGYYHISN